MPYKDLEMKRVWRREYYRKNKEKCLAWNRASRDSHRPACADTIRSPRLKDCPLHGATTAAMGSMRCCWICDVDRNDARLDKYYAVLFSAPPVGECVVCGKEIPYKNGYRAKYCSRICQAVPRKIYETPELGARAHRRRYKERLKLTEYGRKRLLAGKSNRTKAHGGTPYTYKQELALFEKQGRKCAICRCKLAVGAYQRDHIMPLALGGGLDISNIQIVCPSCNQLKGAKHPVEFMQSMGYLL